MKNNRETENTINRFKREIALARTMWLGGLIGVVGAVIAIFAPVVGIPAICVGGMILAGGIVAAVVVDKSEKNKNTNKPIIEVTDYEDITSKENSNDKCSETTNNKQTINEKSSCGKDGEIIR